MENAELEEPEKKRPHFSSDSSPMARNSNLSPDNKSVDATLLQYQNQKLVQQLDAQKHELHDLEVKIQELKERQSSYDDMLTTIKQLWNQLIDDVVFLGVRAGGNLNVLQTLDSEDYSQGSNTSCPAEHVLLCRLLNVDSVKGNGGEDHVKSVEEIFSQHYSSILDLLRFFENFVEDQKKKTFSIAQELHENLSTEGSGADAITKLNKIEDLMTEEATSLRVVIDGLHLKHLQYADRIQSYIQNKSVDETEIKHIAGELEESMAELEESRRKLVNLRMQKNLASETYSPVTGVMNGNLSSLKLPDRSMGLRELKHSIEEAEILAADRLAELEDAREDNSILSKQLEEIEISLGTLATLFSNLELAILSFQKEMKDDKYVCSSRLYTLVNDQLHHWKAEVTRYKTLTDSLQSDRSYLIRREKELELKKESADSAKASIDKAETRVEELELKFQNSIIEKNELEAKMEEAVQDSGRTDIKSEFNVMASALSKEMGMVEAQLNRWKDIAQEALSLRGEAETQKALLNRKTSEVKALGDKCGQQMAEIKSLKELIEKLQKEKSELQIFVDMLGQGSYDNRDLMEIQESERRACAQAEVLKHALDEHNLELRIKAANEAEAACQLRLSVAEAEIADLRAKLDTTEREVCELTEAIKIKDAEAEAYISEIELVSESVKTKQAVNTLLTEKQALAKQFQSVNASLESLRARISRSEEQMKAIMSEALNHCQEDRHLIVSLERAKWELSDVEKELKWVKSAIASSEKEYEQVQRKTADIQKELGSERNDKKKLEEELREWKDRVAEMTAETGEAAIQRLQEEIKDCKSILKCSVCFDRPKEVVIVKCYHLFCNQCIQRNLEIRHRKCPGCGTAFGQNDVRFVKI
uniref:E3 ubiquitin protein ligase n=1 Tax=Chenopodium quinoa TaxID=63459 RepID=A0A803LUS6_CHEQI